MKTPKEAARDLFDAFSNFSNLEYDWGYVFVKSSTAIIKQCCHLTADAVIESWKPTCEGPHAPVLVYWNEVKKEIDLINNDKD